MQRFQHPRLQHLNDNLQPPEIAASARRVDELVAQQQSLLAKNKATLDDADRAGRKLDDEARHTIRRRVSQIEALEDQIDALIDELNSQPGLPRRTPADAGEPLDYAHAGIGVVRTHRDTAPMTAIGVQAALAPYANAARSGGRGVSLVGFARGIATRDAGVLNAAISQNTTFSGPGGGYLVPASLSTALMEVALNSEIVRPRALSVNMLTGTLDLPLADDTDRSGTDVAGLEVRAVSEGTDVAGSKMKLRRVTLQAKRLSVLTAATEELLHDTAGNAERLLGSLMAAAISKRIDRALLVGAGAGEPLGVLNSPACVTQSKVSGQAAGTLLPENLAAMMARLLPESFAKAVWVINPSLLPKLFMLQMLTKNVAQNENVSGSPLPWFTSAPDGSFSLLGRPLLTSDQLPSAGARGDILLADFSQIVVGSVGEMRLDVSHDAGFQAHEIWLRASIRIDGCPILSGPVTPKNGGATLSNFVTLEARS